jgi:hypothetical protein
MLLDSERKNCDDIVAFDEFWFSLRTDNETIWLPSGQGHEKGEKTSFSPKRQTIIARNTGCFHMVEGLLKRVNFNAHYFASKRFGQIVARRSRIVSLSAEKWIMQTDGMPSHAERLSSGFFKTNRPNWDASPILTEFDSL